MDAWVLSHHADIDWLLKQAPVSTNDRHWKNASIQEGRALSSWDRLRRETITFKDGKEHVRLRRDVSRTFTPAAVKRLVPMIESSVREALGSVAEAGGEFDLVSELSSKIPIRVLGALMGVPGEMEDDFCRYAVQLQNAINPLGDEESRKQADLAASHFESMIGTIIDRSLLHPSEDLMSALVHLDAGEDRLSRESIVGIATSIIMAGAETTGALVNHGVLALLRHPDQLALLRADPALLPVAVEELGRFDFPTKFVTRYPLEPIEIDGQVIGRGELVFGALGSANRDAAVFHDPDRLDLLRSPGPSLTFGAGAHFCLGASLARVEAQQMIGQLIRRFPELAIASEPVFSPHFNIRLIESLRLHTGGHFIEH